jgi:hypothetical protein
MYRPDVLFDAAGAVNGAATGNVRRVLRIEGACVLLLGLLAYARFGLGWGSFALCFLAPDLAFLGYLAGARVGAFAYNCTHAYPGALATLALGVWMDSAVATAAGIIWCSHIGFDRMLGYGLKYGAGFGFTHLGLIGRARFAPGQAPAAQPHSERA